MEALVPVFIALIIFVIICWVISLLPMPVSPFPIKIVLYILVACVLIFYLMRYV